MITNTLAKQQPLHDAGIKKTRLRLRLLRRRLFGRHYDQR